MAPRAGRARIRSLADDLRARTDDELAALLQARPELARPVPGDFRALAARATSEPAVARALDELDLGRLRVLQALIVADGSAAAAARLCGVTQARLRPLLADLHLRALIWRDARSYQVPAQVTAALGPYVAGLAPPSPTGPSGSTGPDGGEQLRERIGQLTPAARDVLDRLMWGPPAGEIPAGSPGSTLAGAISQLLGLGLLERISPTRVLLPRAVALHLRGGRIAPGEPLAPPGSSPGTAGPAATSAAVAAVAALLERMDELCHRLGHEPARMLRAGGLGVRELRRLASQLSLESDQAALLLETGRAAGLIGTAEIPSREDDGFCYLPSAGYDAWRHAAPGVRWAQLALAWFETDRVIARPGLAGTGASGSAGADGTVPVLGEGAVSAAARAARHLALSLLAGLDPQGTLSGEELIALARWRHPRRDPVALGEAVTAAVTEGTALGVLAAGGLTEAGRALWAARQEGLRLQAGLGDPGMDGFPGASAALGRLEAALPGPVTRILLQADLTAVAPGRLEGAPADLLRLAGDVESRGGAAVFRFTPRSVRRYLDTGATADDLLAGLARYSPGPVPQPLEYLVRDIARQHGRIRVGAAAAFLVSDDVAALDALEHDGALTGLGLRRLSPTVAVAQAGRRPVAAALRRAGHAPLVEGVSGTVRPGRGPVLRATGCYRPAPADDLPVPGEDAARAAAGVLRAADETAAATPDGPPVRATDPAVTLDVLRAAAASRSAVWLGIAAADGTTSRLLFRPTRVSAGRVHGVLAGPAAGAASGTGGPAAERTYSVHRLIGAIPAAG